MIGVGSFLFAGAAFWAAITVHAPNEWLRRYLIATFAHGLAQGMLLCGGIPVGSSSYGFEWYTARTIQVLCALAYVVDVSVRHKLRTGPLPMLISLIFGVTAWPAVWFNWYTFVFSFSFFLLGGYVVSAPEPAARIMGVYWIAMATFHYAFTILSGDPASPVWRLAGWIPSTLSVSAFVSLAFFESASRYLSKGNTQGRRYQTARP